MIRRSDWRSRNREPKLVPVTATRVILSLLSGINPSILVVPSSPSARPVCEELVEGFSAEKVSVKLAGDKSEAVGCVRQTGPARGPCLADAVTQAKVDGVVLVSTTTRGQQLAVTLQLLSRQGEGQRQETVRGPRSRVAPFARPAIARTMAALRTLLAKEKLQERAAASVEASGPSPPSPSSPPRAAQPPSPRDAPVASHRRLEPTSPPEDWSFARPTPPPVVAQRSPLPGWIAAGVAVAGIGVAATFAGLALSTKSRLDFTDGGVSPLSYNRAVQLRDQTNTDLSIALGAGICVVVAGGVAGALWVK